MYEILISSVNDKLNTIIDVIAVLMIVVYQIVYQWFLMKGCIIFHLDNDYDLYINGKSVLLI